MVYRSAATCVECNELLENVDPSLLSRTSRVRILNAVHVLSAHSTSAESAGIVTHPATVEKETNMTHSRCDYTIAPLSDSVPTTCGKIGVTRATWSTHQDPDGSDATMIYCWLHWGSVQGLPQMEGVKTEDITEERC